MRGSRSWIRLGAAAAAALTACAPVSFAGAGLGTGVRLEISPRGTPSLGLTSCALVGSQSTALGPNASAQALARRQEIAAIQSQLSLGSNSLRARMSSMKRLASGDC